MVKTIISVDPKKAPWEQETPLHFECLQFGDTKLVLVAVGQRILHAAALGEPGGLGAVFVGGDGFGLAEDGGTGRTGGDAGERLFQECAAGTGGIVVKDHGVAGVG